MQLMFRGGLAQLLIAWFPMEQNNKIQVEKDRSRRSELGRADGRTLGWPQPAATGHSPSLYIGNLLKTAKAKGCRHLAAANAIATATTSHRPLFLEIAVFPFFF